MFENFTILCCLWRRLSLVFYKAFAMIIFLSLKFFTVLFSMELFIGYLKTFPLETEGGSERYEYVRNGRWGVVAFVRVRIMGGQIFVILVLAY